VSNFVHSHMFFGHCHRTRFHDSFCLASVFEMTVYLLTYLLNLLTWWWQLVLEVV